MTITLTPLLVIWIVRSYFPKINTEQTNKQTRQLVGQRGRTCQEMESAADDDDDDEGNVVSN